jgi:hypothetical protein
MLSAPGERGHEIDGRADDGSPVRTALDFCSPTLSRIILQRPIDRFNLPPAHAQPSTA